MNKSDILTMLLYGLDIMSAPSLSKVTGGMEKWRRYNRANPSRLQHLRKRGLLEDGDSESGWAIRLTAEGRLQALGGRDPAKRWARPWDGRWRILLFDLSSDDAALRKRLLRWLRSNHFGLLQRSAWISPDPCSDLRELLDEQADEVGSFVILDSKRCAASDAQSKAFVGQAWDFGNINEKWKLYLEHVGTGIPKSPTKQSAQSWIEEENRAWHSALRGDPLLPDELLPEGYLGATALKARRSLFAKADPLLVALQPE